MNQPKKIVAYIRDLFATYSLNYQEFFSEFTDFDEFEEIPLVVNDELDLAQIQRAATILGVNPEDLVTMDDSATRKWYKKYPYFFHKIGFDYAYKRSFYDEKYDKLRIFEVLFDKELTPKEPTRYNYDDVVRRLLDLLKEFDKSIPGTFHEGAHITKLLISTENFCHYEKVGEMLQSYTDMVNRAKKLFFKAWDEELTPEEIQEYNLIVSAVGLQDREYAPFKYLYYDMLRRFVDTYRSEGYKEFFSFVRIRPQRVLTVWKCAEFAQDKALTQKFINIYPAAKQEMRKFAMKVSKFECFFIWSDAKPIHYSPEEEAELNEFDEMLDEEPFTEENHAKEPTVIYVPKTSEELNGDEQYAEMLRVLASPANLGGVSVTKSEIDGLTSVQRMGRMITRVAANSGHSEDA